MSGTHTNIESNTQSKTESSKQAILASLGLSSIHRLNQLPDLSILKTNMTDKTILITQFEKGLNSVTGELIHPESGNSIDLLNTQIAQLIRDGMRVISLVDTVQGNESMPLQPHQLKHIDYAVIKARFAVAENGAVWIDSQQLNAGKKISHRVLPFICENLIIVLEQGSIVATMHDASPLMRLHSGEFGTFIAGPSKTADIEQALVVGAHGAFSLKVYLI